MSIIFALLAAVIVLLQMFGDYSEIYNVQLTLTWGIFLICSCITGLNITVKAIMPHPETLKDMFGND